MLGPCKCFVTIPHLGGDGMYVAYPPVDWKRVVAKYIDLVVVQKALEEALQLSSSLLLTCFDIQGLLVEILGRCGHELFP